MPSIPQPPAGPLIALPPDFTFHHLGVACESIADDAQTWSLFGYRPEGDIFVDEAQGIRGLFMTGGGPRLELLEPTEGSSTLAPWLKRRVKLYHAGYRVDSFDAAMEYLVAQGAAIARPPMMSAYFKTRIVFLMMANMALIELIDSSPASPATEAEFGL